MKVSSTRLNLFLLPLAILLPTLLVMGCPEETKPAPAPEVLGECRKNLDCGPGSICEKLNEDDEWGACIKLVCTSDEDCDEGEVCEDRRGICIPANTCDPANPQAACEPGQVCVYEDGVPVCRDASDLTPPDTCAIAPGRLFMGNGSTAEIKVSGFLESGAMAPNAEFTITGDEALTLTDGTVTGTCTATTPCNYTITATALVGEASCEATVTIFPAVAEADFRVAVFDETDNGPLASARVVAKLTDGTLDAQETNADGLYTWVGKANDIEAISVFEPYYHWQTIVAPPANDVALYTKRVPNPTRVSGMKGHFNFDNVQTFGEVKMALAGTPISGDWINLDFDNILGEIASTAVDIPDIFSGNMLMPSGFTFEISDEPMKDYFVIFDDPGPSTLWALGGKLKLADVGDIIGEVATSTVDEVNIGSILAQVLPFFNTFSHAAVTGLEVFETDRPANPFGGAIDYERWDNLLEFTDESAVNLNTMLTQSHTYEIPSIPCVPGKISGSTCIDGAYTTGVVLASGTIVPGQGVVPLGISLGLDDPDSEDNENQVDGMIDYLAGTIDTPGAGYMIVDAAPQHDGLEGNLLTTMAFALDVNSVTEGNLSVSILTHIADSFGVNNGFPAGDFLEFQTGTFNNSTHVFTKTEANPDAFFVIKGMDSSEGLWNVWFPGDVTEVDLNSLRTSDELAGTSRRDTEIEIQALRLGTGYTGQTASTFSDLMQFNGTNADRLNYYLGAWSTVTCAPVSEINPSPGCVVE
ncbi:MAG: hypothetical protein CMH56_05080 [Myxococcales bacterium]|nr:hypothetical protein [Myxococcales bacterium]